MASQMPEIIAQAGTGVGKGFTFPFHQMRPDLSGEMISRAEAYDQPTLNIGQMFDHLSDELSKVAPFEGDKAIYKAGEIAGELTTWHTMFKSIPWVAEAFKWRLGVAKDAGLIERGIDAAKRASIIAPEATLAQLGRGHSPGEALVYGGAGMAGFEMIGPAARAFGKVAKIPMNAVVSASSPRARSR